MALNACAIEGLLELVANAWFEAGQENRSCASAEMVQQTVRAELEQRFEQLILAAELNRDTVKAQQRVYNAIIDKLDRVVHDWRGKVFGMKRAKR